MTVSLRGGHVRADGKRRSREECGRAAANQCDPRPASLGNGVCRRSPPAVARTAHGAGASLHPASQGVLGDNCVKRKSPALGPLPSQSRVTVLPYRTALSALRICISSESSDESLIPPRRTCKCTSRYAPTPHDMSHRSRPSNLSYGLLIHNLAATSRQPKRRNAGCDSARPRTLPLRCSRRGA